MSYNFEFAMSARVSQATVEEMVKKIVEQQTGRKIKTVSFHTKEVSDPMDRYSHSVVDGCTVTFDEKSSIPSGPIPRNSLGNQINDIESGNVIR